MWNNGSGSSAMTSAAVRPDRKLCARYWDRRKTGYKWLARYEADGRRGLSPTGRAPRHCPHRIPDAVAQLLCAARRVHPQWGPKQLLDWLRPRHRRITDWPAASTVGDLLVREGLITKRRRRRPPNIRASRPAGHHRAHRSLDCRLQGAVPTQRSASSAIRSPSPISIRASRSPVTACALSTHGVLARPIFERAFREYGLPRAIRTDNGVPFATQAIHGLSDLNVWWMRLGIQHQRIHPGCPQENGAHERMHAR